MNKDNIPEGLRHLIDLVNKWGINDDGYREEQIEKSSLSDLQQVVNAIDENTLKYLNAWLSDEKAMKESSDEYINYTCFYMAYEYAEAQLKNKKENFIE
jgi:hypothetical protein